MYPKISWPNNKQFAFTIFDDTDRANLRNIQSVYECLNELDIKTTKSVWVIEGNSSHEDSGITCDNEIYLNLLLELKNKGFEIGYHNTTYHSSYRQDIEKGLKKFVKMFNQNPNVMANHSANRENIYWGSHIKIIQNPT